MGRGLGRGSSCRCNSVHTFSNKPELVHLCLFSAHARRVGVLGTGGEGGPDSSGPEHLLGCGSGPPGNAGLPAWHGRPHSRLTAHGQSTGCFLSSRNPDTLQL